MFSRWVGLVFYGVVGECFEDVWVSVLQKGWLVFYKGLSECFTEGWVN